MRSSLWPASLSFFTAIFGLGGGLLSETFESYWALCGRSEERL